jgi:PhnB protein
MRLYRSSGQEITTGNNFAISVSAASQDEADAIFKGLATGGMVTMPLNKTFRGAYFGMLTDKSGINWMVGYEESND